MKLVNRRTFLAGGMATGMLTGLGFSAELRSAVAAAAVYRENRATPWMLCIL